VNTKTKSVLAVVLVIGGGAVWIPQLVGAKPAGSADPPLEVSNEIGAFEAPALPVPEVGYERGGESAPLDAPDVSDAEQITRALANAKELSAQRGGLDLGALLAALDPGRGGADPAALADAGAGRLEADRRLLATTAATLDITGTLAGPDPLALIDGRLVRAGEALDDERVRVDEVAAGSIVLACGEARLRVRLAPLRVRASAPGGGVDSAAAEEAAGASEPPSAGGLADVLPALDLQNGEGGR